MNPIKCDCGKKTVFKCAICSENICPAHVRIKTICSSHVKKNHVNFTIKNAKTVDERKEIKNIVNRFWEEDEHILSFDNKYLIEELPSIIAVIDTETIGFLSYTENGNNIIIVAFGVLPSYQYAGVGTALIKKVEEYSISLKKEKLLVATSNDDLPSLSFYQSRGFQIYEVKPNVIAEKHGAILEGIGKIPIRDEIRLQKSLCAY